jgi:L-alanine-DL-glutamate epimerase-like enolase superfamily enzyme
VTGQVLPPLSLAVAIERFPIRGAFTIARGSRTEAVVVTATVSDGVTRGRGECVPYARYGENPEGVAAALAAEAGRLGRGGPHGDLTAGLKAGAARNALDCALWDYRAKAAGEPAWRLAGASPPRPLLTCFTISLGTPEAMAAATAEAAGRPLLKIKLGGEGDAERIAAVRRAAPGARLVVDANEAWTVESLPRLAAACADAGVELIEQPLPAAADDGLLGFRSPVPLCADESAHGLGSLAHVRERYGAINIKLDKTGGLTAALELSRAARAEGLRVMLGCMLGTSLAMAPALLPAADADVVDLDGPLLLAADRTPALSFDGSVILPPGPELWG